jgi:hypothetical protein
MARKAAAEGERLTGALLTLATITAVVDVPSDEPAPTVQEMIDDLHKTYRCYTRQPPEARFKAIAESAAPRADEDHVADRVSTYGSNLHAIVEHAGNPEQDSTAVDDRKLVPADTNLIRKAWELADSPIHMTTKLWLTDGDVSSNFAWPHADEPPAGLIAFHGEMARLGAETWGELIRLVSQLLATLIGTLKRIRRTGTTSTGLWREAQHKKEFLPEEQPMAVAPPSLKPIFGNGGELFLTDTPAGRHGGIRTLVQLNGAIITRITPECLDAPDLLRSHQERIAVWFAANNRRWARWRHALTGMATAGSAAGIVYGAADVHHWHQLVAGAALTVVSPLARRGIAVATRRFVLRAMKGPKALLPASPQAQIGPPQLALESGSRSTNAGRS